MSQTAVLVTNFNLGDPAGAVEIQEVAIPEPKEGEVLVNIKLRPVNPADLFSVQGVYPGYQPKALPSTAGLEGFGVVAKNGPGCSKFAEGTRVVAFPWNSKEGLGTWAQYQVVKEKYLAAIPDDINDETAAQAQVNPVTVVGMLNMVNVPQGEYLLNNAAGSVLGRQVIELAKHRGIKTINIVRRSEAAEELLNLGGDHVLVSTDEDDIVAKVDEITGGKKARAALEPVGGDGTATIVSSVSNGGTVVVYGAMGGLDFKVGIPDVVFRGVTIKGYWVAQVLEESSDADREALVNETLSYLSQGVIKPYAGVKFSLKDAKQAILESVKVGRGGKVLLEG